MRTITLKTAWTYHSIEKTIDFPPGEHEVTNEIAAQAEADGVIPKEETGGATDSTAKTGKTGAADAGKG